MRANHRAQLRRLGQRILNFGRSLHEGWTLPHSSKARGLLPSTVSRPPGSTVAGSTVAGMRGMTKDGGFGVIAALAKLQLRGLTR
jgi:hypothetical protein